MEAVILNVIQWFIFIQYVVLADMGLYEYMVNSWNFMLKIGLYFVNISINIRL